MKSERFLARYQCIRMLFRNCFAVQKYRALHRAELREILSVLIYLSNLIRRTNSAMWIRFIGDRKARYNAYSIVMREVLYVKFARRNISANISVLRCSLLTALCDNMLREREREERERQGKGEIKKKLRL